MFISLSVKYREKNRLERLSKCARVIRAKREQRARERSNPDCAQKREAQCEAARSKYCTSEVGISTLGITAWVGVRRSHCRTPPRCAKAILRCLRRSRPLPPGEKGTRKSLHAGADAPYARVVLTRLLFSLSVSFFLFDIIIPIAGVRRGRLTTIFSPCYSVRIIFAV